MAAARGPSFGWCRWNAGQPRRVGAVVEPGPAEAEGGVEVAAGNSSHVAGHEHLEVLEDLGALLDVELLALGHGHLVNLRVRKRLRAIRTAKTVIIAADEVVGVARGAALRDETVVL